MNTKLVSDIDEMAEICHCVAEKMNLFVDGGKDANWECVRPRKIYSKDDFLQTIRHLLKRLEESNSACESTSFSTGFILVKGRPDASYAEVYFHIGSIFPDHHDSMEWKEDSEIGYDPVLLGC